MAFSDDLNAATAQIDDTDTVRTDVRAAFTTLQASLTTAVGNYKGGAGLNIKDTLDIDVKLIDLARDMGSMLR